MTQPVTGAVIATPGWANADRPPSHPFSFARREVGRSRSVVLAPKWFAAPAPAGPWAAPPIAAERPPSSGARRCPYFDVLLLELVQTCPAS